MRLSCCFSFLSLLAWNVVSQAQWPIHDNGLNKVVEWYWDPQREGDYCQKADMMASGITTVILSTGRDYYWRVPVPEVWIDILQKVKAAGFNTVSFYSNWGYHSAADGTLDFETASHDFTRLFDIAKEIGLYVLFRPGPYVNAEASAGGFPGWLTTGAYGTLRNNDSRYTDAWTPFFSKISQIVSEHQVTKGGNVFIYQIENEYGNQWLDANKKIPNSAGITYMELLEASARAHGIDVPLIHNNPNMRTKSWSKDYSDVGGNVDNYAFDHYPSCWSCDLSECGGTNGNVPEFTVYDYYNNFQEVAPTQPSFLAEFQGGSYNPWTGPAGGCVNTTGPDWVNVFYKHNIAQKVTAMNVYMVFGGTNWGGLPFPMVGTSYDYSAPISESRIIGDKYHETKLFGQFVRVARDLTKVDRISNSTGYTSTPDIFTTELRNPDTNGGFYVTLHTSSPSTALTPFKLKVNTSAGNLTIPQYANSSIVLNGRQSKIIVTDFKVGSEKLIYSTAEVLTVSIQDKLPIIVLWLPPGEKGEFFLTGVHDGQLTKRDGTSNIDFHPTRGGLIVSYTQLAGSSVIEFNNRFRVVLVDRLAAYYTWVPSISSDPFTPENSTIIVLGSYLVRSTAIEGNTLKLDGDYSDTTSLEIYAPSSIHKVLFNNKETRVHRTPQGSLIGDLSQPTQTTTTIKSLLPALTNWKSADGLPERKLSYDDSKWTSANHNQTVNPTPPATYPVLYADEYGYHTGNILWRGYFSSSNTTATGVFLSVIGGTASGWSAYLNGVFIGSWLGDTKTTQGELTLDFGNATLGNGSNVLFVIQDHMGHDQTGGATNPRGIFNVTLFGGGKFTEWKVAGNAGGEANLDKVRGTYNEGGLHAERLGWHLPGFDDSAWESESPGTGLQKAGAKFYRTVVPLDIPRGYDVSLGFVIGSTPGSRVRVQLYVNGYMFGKYVEHIGNQVVFPVYPGILDYHGDNTIGLSVWAQGEEGGSVSLDWTVLGVVESSFDPGFEGDYLRPAWINRSSYY